MCSHDEPFYDQLFRSRKKYGCGTHFKNMSGTGKAPVRKANDEEVRGGDSPVRNTQLFFLQYTCPLKGLASLFPGFLVVLPSSFFLTVRGSSCQHTLRWMEGHPPIRISNKQCSMLRMISGSQQSIRIMEDRAPLPSTGSKGERETWYAHFHFHSPPHLSFFHNNILYAVLELQDD